MQPPGPLPHEDLIVDDVAELLAVQFYSSSVGSIEPTTLVPYRNRSDTQREGSAGGAASMAGYEVVIEKIAEAGKAAQRVADAIGSLDFAGTISNGDLGMPGARAVGKLATVKQGWTGREKRIAGGFTDYAHTMTQAADFYRTHEEAAQRELQQLRVPRGMS
jgi:hypothetical protein